VTAIGIFVRALAGRLQRHRTAVALAVAVVAVLAGELMFAATTYGTADVLIFSTFADTVRHDGPVHIYGLEHAGLNVYNHPPLVGRWLQLVNGATDLGANFSFMIRLPSVLAHTGTVLLVYAILRRRVTGTVALASALLVAASPLLVIVSGFHGNNDTVVAACTILSVYLLVDRRWPVLAGLAFSVAISIKIVPIIALPLLLVAAWRLGRWRDVGRFATGGVPLFVVLWLPVLVSPDARGFIDHVLAYNGEGFPRVWGLYQLGEWTGTPSGVLTCYVSIGSYLVLAIAALVPAVLVRRMPGHAPAALGLCISLFLSLTPSWAPQYTAWIGATVFLIEFWSATLFTIAVGAVYGYFYSYWNGFKVWSVGNVAPPTPEQQPYLVLAWLCTLLTAVVGVRQLMRAPPPRTSTVDDTAESPEPPADQRPAVASSSRDSR
jgi:4-amino-4-deoxy-L-arabinose transferase-like glycosyltransferase